METIIILLAMGLVGIEVIIRAYEKEWKRHSEAVIKVLNEGTTGEQLRQSIEKEHEIGRTKQAVYDR